MLTQRKLVITAVNPTATGRVAILNFAVPLPCDLQGRAAGRADVVHVPKVGPGTEQISRPKQRSMSHSIPGTHASIKMNNYQSYLN